MTIRFVIPVSEVMNELIDQNPQTQETPAEEPAEPEAPSFIQRIMAVIRYIIDLVKSFIIK